MWRTIVLCIFVIMATVNGASNVMSHDKYKNHCVIAVTQTTNEALEKLITIGQVIKGTFLEGENLYLDRAHGFLVSAHKLQAFLDTVKKLDVSHKIVIEDVYKWLTKVKRNRITRSHPSFDFTSYRTLHRIYFNLDELATYYPNEVQTVVGGFSHKGHQIKGVKVSFKENNPGIFLEGGIHGERFISSATVMYILHQLLTSNDPHIRELAEAHDWYIFPVFDTDKYEYTMKLYRGETNSDEILYIAADLDRNWGYKWNSTGTVSPLYFLTYPGDAPFSENASKSMSEYINSISDKFYAYISFQCYGRFLLFPYCYTKEHIEDYNELYDIATKAITALKKKYGTEYKVGNVAEMLHEKSGCTIDYIRGTYNKRLVYQYKMQDDNGLGIQTSVSNIIPNGEEIMDSLVAMFKEAVARGYHKA